MSRRPPAEPPCPCGSGAPLVACCGRFLEGKADAPDAERLTDFGRAAPTGGQRLNSSNLFSRQSRPSTFAATRPRSRKPGHRPFNDQAPLKFSQSREHMEHQTPGRRAGFYAFRRAFKADAGRFQFAHDLDQLRQ